MPRLNIAFCLFYLAISSTVFAAVITLDRTRLQKQQFRISKDTSSPSSSTSVRSRAPVPHPPNARLSTYQQRTVDPSAQKSSFISKASFPMTKLHRPTRATRTSKLQINNIWNGKETTPNDYPWAVSIAEYLNADKGDFSVIRHVCGGTLIRKNIVLTAAHCVLAMKNLTHFTVFARRHDLRVSPSDEDALQFKIKNVVKHHAFTANEGVQFLANDIALIILDNTEPLPFDLPELPEGPADSKLPVTYVGWGRIDPSEEERQETEADTETPRREKPDGAILGSPVLLKAQTTVVEWLQCHLFFKGFNIAFGPSSICIRRKGPGIEPAGILKGDSGGPLFSVNEDGKHVLQGIASWRSTFGPDVFSNVGHFRKWLDGAIEKIESVYH